MIYYCVIIVNLHPVFSSDKSMNISYYNLVRNFVRFGMAGENYVIFIVNLFSDKLCLESHFHSLNSLIFYSLTIAYRCNQSWLAHHLRSIVKKYIWNERKLCQIFNERIAQLCSLNKIFSSILRNKV